MGEQWLLYLSAAGFAASLALWPYLLLQYRKEDGAQAPAPFHVEAPTLVPLPAAKPAPAAAKPAVEKAVPSPVVSKSDTAPKKLVPIPNEAPAHAPPPATLKTGATNPGGISPAVVYLEGVKNQLQTLEKDVMGLKDQVSSLVQHSDSRFDAVLKRLGELSEQLRAPGEASPPVEVGATLVIPPEPQPESPPPASLELAPPPDEPPSSPPSDAPPPKRRGPVWPV